jgi:hypothetical protein
VLVANTNVVVRQEAYARHHALRSRRHAAGAIFTIALANKASAAFIFVLRMLTTAAALPKLTPVRRSAECALLSPKKMLHPRALIVRR